MAGFHEVQAPHLGRPGATPPPPPPLVPRYQVPEPTVNGFKPILGPRIPIQRRRQPASLDYGTDIITIYDVNPKKLHKVNNDTLIRTVSSSFQVKREDKEKKAGRVFDDVIYDLPVDTQDFKPQESNVYTKAVKHDRLSGWRKIA